MYTFGGNRKWYTVIENIMVVLQTFKNRIYNPAFPSIYAKELKSRFSNICTPIFIAALYTKGSQWTQPRCPSTDNWINKMWHIIQWNTI